MSRALLLPLLCATALAGCGAPQRVDPGPRGTLRFRGEPPEATVFVDEQRLGPIGMFEKQGVLLRPGTHRVVVRAPGHFPEYREVEIVEGETAVLEISLREVPP